VSWLTVPAVLAQRLNAAAPPAWEVINAGVQGYDTVAEARMLETAGVGLRPAVVVVGMSLNDYDPAPAYSPTGVLLHRELGRTSTRPADRSEFLMLLRWLLAYARGDLWYQVEARVDAMRAGPDGGRLAGIDDVVRGMHERFYRSPTPANWDRLRAGLASLRRTADEHHEELLVAIFPESWQIGVPAPDLTPQARLLDACREARVRCLDLAPAFAAAGGALFLDAQHPNVRGHEVAADAIAAALLGRGEESTRVGGGGCVGVDADQRAGTFDTGEVVQRDVVGVLGLERAGRAVAERTHHGEQR